jgi:DNA processing protein
MSACAKCLLRSWLLGRLAGRLERVRNRLDELLALSDLELIEAIGGGRESEVFAEARRVNSSELRARSTAAGLELICACDPAYPPRLRDLDSPPAVLHIAGGRERFLELVAAEPVAVVGARRASDYGLEAARALGRGLGSAGVTVVSGMALGVDSATHAGTLEVGGPTVAVLPAGAERSYPPSKHALYRRIQAGGAVVSELPPGTAVWRWAFQARNRIIAALSAMTVVTEGRERSGALITARYARQLRRPVGAVPGRITAPLAAGPNALLAAGAKVIRGPQDVLDALFGAGARSVRGGSREPLDPDIEMVLDAVADGHDTVAGLASAGIAADQALSALSALELAGYVRREAGGRYVAVP